jgi:hypothetical protein
MTKIKGCYAKHVLVLAQMENPCKGDRLVIDYLLNVLRAGRRLTVISGTIIHSLSGISFLACCPIMLQKRRI